MSDGSWSPRQMRAVVAIFSRSPYRQVQERAGLALVLGLDIEGTERLCRELDRLVVEINPTIQPNVKKSQNRVAWLLDHCTELQEIPTVADCERYAEREHALSRSGTVKAIKAEVLKLRRAIWPDAPKASGGKRARHSGTGTAS